MKVNLPPVIITKPEPRIVGTPRYKPRATSAKVKAKARDTEFYTPGCGSGRLNSARETPNALGTVKFSLANMNSREHSPRRTVTSQKDLEPIDTSVYV